jgi:hypothetical protein
MKIMLLVLLAAGATVSAQGGKPASCTNVPVSFTFEDHNPGLSSDGNVTYTNGNGVTAILNCNGESAELAGTRPTYLNLNFSQPLDGTGPSWPASAPISFFNIPFGKFFSTQLDPNKYSFTTYLKVTMASSNPGFFYMENPNATAPLNPPSSGVNNSTCNTTLVNVDHFPAGTYQNQTGAPETWVVYPDPTPQTPLCSGSPTVYNVGTVEYSLPKNKTGTAQFSVPFKITIQRLS